MSKKVGQKKEKAPIFKNNWFMLKHIYKASKLRFWCLVLENIFSSVFSAICDVYLVKVIFDDIQNGKPFSSIIPLFIIISILSILRRCFSGYYWWYICHYTDQELYEYLNSMMFKKAILADLDCYEDPEYFNKYMVASREIYDRSVQILSSVCALFGRIASITTILTVLSTMDIRLALVALVPAVLTMPLMLLEAKLWPEFKKVMEPQNRKKDYVQRTVYLAQYAKEYRLTNIFTVMKKRYCDMCDEIRKVETKFRLKAAILYITRSLANWMVLTVMAPIFIAYQVLFTPGFSIGSFVATLNALPRLSWSIRAILQDYTTFKQHALFVQNILEFYNTVPKIKQNENGLLPDKKNNVLELKNVTFTYKGQTEPILKNISMKIEAGEKVAFVGQNGAGKSTIVKLIMRLYEPDSGEILLNGEPVEKYNLRAYYDMFGTIFQDFQMYSLTVAENVLMREVKGEEDRETVIKALKLSGAYDKVMSLKNGIDTILTREFEKEGVNLSGGENQKVAIARVFANNAPFVILDEPSSALDPIAEYKIYDSIHKATDEKTVIFISHRLSSTKMADMIYLFAHGEIAEQGSHDELMALNGQYAEMFNKQAENYKKSPVHANAGGDRND